MMVTPTNFVPQVNPSFCPHDTVRSLLARAAKPSGRVHSTLDGFSQSQKLTDSVECSPRLDESRRGERKKKRKKKERN